MAEEINKTADWAPGTLDKTRKNIGDISEKDAAVMAKKLGGQVMYERTTPSAGSPNKAGRIVRNNSSSGGAGAGSGSGGAGAGGGYAGGSSSSIGTGIKKHKREELPSVSKKTAAAIDKLMMAPEYKIKPNYGVFNFVRSWQKNGTEKILPEFFQYNLKQMTEHMEAFITVIKTFIQISPATYKTKIATGTETKFKFLRMVAGWTMQGIKTEYIELQNIQGLIVADLIPIVRAIYKSLITVYYYGNNKIPKLIKEIYGDMIAYPDAPKDKLSIYAKQAITEWLYLDTEIIKKLYPLLMRMCSDSYEPYPSFFNAKAGEILKFLDLHKFDLLLPEKQKEPEPEEKPKKATPPQKGLRDSSVETGLKLLNQMFPDAGFDRLDEHPDMYPYFQPMFGFDDGFNMISPENPIQVIAVLHYIIENCFQGCRNIVFKETEEPKKGAESIRSVMDDWAAYREECFETLYCGTLRDFVNTLYAQPDFETSQAGKRAVNSLLWQTLYHFLPSFKFDKLILEHPTDESKYRPLFHRTDYARKYLTVVINECDANAKTKGKCNLIDNPWDHYKFDIQNEVSKRIDVLLGAQNKGANTTATNANLLKYTLCFISVLDWWINNPESPAYTSNPMNMWRVSPQDGRPLFSVPERNDQNKLFVEAVKASYKQSAK